MKKKPNPRSCFTDGCKLSYMLTLQDITSVLPYGSMTSKKVNILVEVNEIKVGDIWSFSIPMYCVALFEHHYWLVLLKDSSLINTSKNHGTGWVLISYNSHGKILSVPGLDINLYDIKEDEKKEERFGHCTKGNEIVKNNQYIIRENTAT